MDVILIPGFWLDAASWAPVTTALDEAGHRAHPLTLPGKVAPQGDVSGIGLRDHVDTVVAALDALDGRVVLVGHSGGGAVIHAVADARPDRVARTVYVDSGPLGHGGVINDELPVVDGGIPLPDWSAFGEEELEGLDEQLRAHFREIALVEPAGVATEQQVLGDERRYGIPATVITCSMPEAVLRGLIADGHPYVAELAAITDVTVVELPTGHWPQLTRPDDLATAVVAAVG